MYVCQASSRIAGVLRSQTALTVIAAPVKESEARGGRPRGFAVAAPGSVVVIACAKSAGGAWQLAEPQGYRPGGRGGMLPPGYGRNPAVLAAYG